MNMTQNSGSGIIVYRNDSIVKQMLEDGACLVGNRFVSNINRTSLSTHNIEELGARRACCDGTSIAQCHQKHERTDGDHGEVNDEYDKTGFNVGLIERGYHADGDSVKGDVECIGSICEEVQRPRSDAKCQ